MNLKEPPDTGGSLPWRPKSCQTAGDEAPSIGETWDDHAQTSAGSERGDRRSRRSARSSSCPGAATKPWSQPAGVAGHARRTAHHRVQTDPGGKSHRLEQRPLRDRYRLWRDLQAGGDEISAACIALHIHHAPSLRSQCRVRAPRLQRVGDRLANAGRCLRPGRHEATRARAGRTCASSSISTNIPRGR